MGEDQGSDSIDVRRLSFYFVKHGSSSLGSVQLPINLYGTLNVCHMAHFCSIAPAILLDFSRVQKATHPSRCCSNYHLRFSTLAGQLLFQVLLRERGNKHGGNNRISALLYFLAHSFCHPLTQVQLLVAADIGGLD